MGRKKNVVHHTLSWQLVAQHTKKKQLIQFWACSEYPGLVLTWICKEKVADSSRLKEWPFSGFNSTNLKDLIAEWEKVSEQLEKKSSRRVRLKAK